MEVEQELLAQVVILDLELEEVPIWADLNTQNEASSNELDESLLVPENLVWWHWDQHPLRVAI